jgi:hypothetical protein
VPNTDVLPAREALDQLRTWNAAEASEQTIFAGDGANLSTRLRRTRRQQDPRYLEHLAEAAELYGRVLDGSRYAYMQFTEAMSTSDFSFLFADILDRQILAKYQSAPVTWDRIAKRGRVRDFRTVKRFVVNGGEAVLTQVKELTEYPQTSVADAAYSYAVSKFGRRIGLSWETLINDDLDAFSDIPDRLGNAARRSEEKFVTGLFAGASGPNATFFAAGNKNIVTSGTLNPALSISALQAAFTVLASQLDTDGAPIVIEAVTLVVPPALLVPAQNILNATQIWTATGSGGANSDPGRPDQLQTVNWMANKVQLVVNPWLPLVSSSANGNTSWYLFANPSMGRPAMEVGFLIGHETPDLFAKQPNATRIGGGAIAPEDGDFETDSIDWKIRHVFGGVLMDPKMAFASNGSGA